MDAYEELEQFFRQQDQSDEISSAYDDSLKSMAVESLAKIVVSALRNSINSAYTYAGPGQFLERDLETLLTNLTIRKMKELNKRSHDLEYNMMVCTTFCLLALFFVPASSQEDFRL